MPNKDRTGPLGEGPRTGRGLGPCGTGTGIRRGIGAGRGFGNRQNFNQTEISEDKIEKLEEENIELRKELKKIKDKLENL